MLTLKQILESDSVSSLVAKVNLNFQQIAVSGGGPQGIPGEQGIPGLPGRQGPIGPTGMKGPTGSVVGLIPFASQTGGTTGPTGIAGPWNTYSYEYLNTYAGTGPSVVGNIWIDHWNDGFWQYLDQSNANILLTESPYQHPAVGTNPPGGTGYYSTEGWYFYPAHSQGGGGAGGDVWINDITTYQTTPPYEQGTVPGTPGPAPALTVKNARLLSKYGTVWISSGNSVDDNASNAGDESNLTTPTIHDWGNPNATSPGGPFSQPGRYVGGIDRLYFKQSIDTLPYSNNVTARSYILASGGSGDPAEENTQYPEQGVFLQGPSFWPKPLYSPSLDAFSPIQFYTERRNDLNASYPAETIYGSLGLFSYTSQYPGKDVNSLDYRKSLWVYSTRKSLNPDENTGGDPLVEANTFNLGEMLLDVRKLTTSNQYVCSLPQDLYLSADALDGNIYDEASSTLGYTVTQGYISAINGKNLVSSVSSVNTFNYGNGANATGYNTRSSWYGSAAMFKPEDWEKFDSGDAGNTTDTHIADRTYRFAGMRERAKKSYNGTETFFLNELTFYTSQFSLNGSNIDATPGSGVGMVDLKLNEQQSLPGFYLSPFRNFGIGTFADDDSGVFEPIARLHAHTFVRGAQYDGGNIQEGLNGWDSTTPWLSKYTQTGTYQVYPANIYKGGALTLEDTSSTYLDFNIGNVNPPTHELSNALATGNPNTKPTSILDTAIRRETWNNISYGQAGIMRLGVSPIAHNSTTDFRVGSIADWVKYDFQIALSPLNPMSGYEVWNAKVPVGVGIQNLYPRARFHIFGKNLTNPILSGEEPISPGEAAAAGTTADSGGYYPWSNYSGNQVIIDHIQSSWTYNAGFRDYPYEAYGVVGLTGLAANLVTPATGISGSPNAANYPVWEKYVPTRNVLPWSVNTRNYAAFGYTGSAQGLAQVYMHGQQYQNLFNAKQYIGFNLFRDLLNVGDDRDETRWRLGTAGDNGGSAIITSPSGDMVFVNIPSGRDGGLQYRPFEQQGLSTRDVLNNVSLVITPQGDMGIGTQPGVDYSAFASLERYNYNGYLNYVPVVGDARGLYPSNTGIMGTGPGTNKPYGLINYSGMTALYSETMTDSAAAKINANASQNEYIRFDVGAQKFYGKPGRTSLATGYGYPPQTDIIITGTAVRDYLLLDWAAYTAAGGICDRLILATDFEGRIWYVTIQNQALSAPFVDPRNYSFAGLLMPHPTEFNAGGPLGSLYPGFVAPSGAAAAIMQAGYAWSINSTVLGSWGLDNTSFENSPIGIANMRLNNFIAGEGMNPASEQDWVRTQVKQARQQSPKLIFTFLEADNTTIPGTKSTNTSETIGTNRPVSGTAAYRKVNTVIASAQNESTLREYWIPKSDNTGGTFMVWTDHYGNKEHEHGFDSTVATNRFYVEEVVALEFVPSYTGVSISNEYISGTATNLVGRTDKDYPLHVKYYNSLIGVPKFGVTGSTANAFSPAQYGRKVNLFGQPLGLTGGPISQFTYENTSAGGLALGNANWVQNTTTTVLSKAGSLTGTICTSPPITTTGKPTQINITGIGFASSAVSWFQLRIMRDTTLIGPTYTIDPTNATSFTDGRAIAMEWIDTPSAAAHTYSLVLTYKNAAGEVQFGQNAGGAAGFAGITISVVELDSAPITSTGGGAIGTTGGSISGTGATGLALLRNVDKYYNLISSSSWDDNWSSGTGPDGFTNEASQFRFKRINSDMALVDFNMTIQVRNPDVQNDYANNETGYTNLIDAGSPRWTQYIRLAYLPTLNTGINDNNYFMKLFGNSLSFMNWSSYNQWYPGTAVTSDLIPGNITPGDSLTKTQGPNYTMNTGYDPAHTQNLVWSGNFYDATMSSNVASTQGDYTHGQILGNPGTTTDTYSHSNITPFFGNSFYNAGISKMLIWDNPAVAYDGDKAHTFGSFMGKAYSILGNDYLSRVRNCTWRLVPRIGTAYGDGVDLTAPTQIKNNSFTLEVMFDKPILHIDTPFAKYNFSSTADTGACNPYQYLTVSGQAMVRYSDATNTTFDGPTTVLSGVVGGGGGGTYTLNQPLNGGNIAYIDETGLHGLIVMPSIVPGGIASSWSTANSFLVTSVDIGTGQANSNTITAAFPGTASAAGLSADPTYFSPSGGYLPSRNELAAILANANAGLIPSYTWNPGYYWSSSASGLSSAWRVNLAGVQDTFAKTDPAGYTIVVLSVKSF